MLRPGSYLSSRRNANNLPCLPCPFTSISIIRIKSTSKISYGPKRIFKTPENRQFWGTRAAWSDHVVCTSEFWWEEEEEFDALTDYLERKAILCVTPELNENQIDQLRTFITNNRVAAIFSSYDTSAFAERVWQGFDGPPLFRKIRYRSQIDESASAEDVGSFLEQVLQQNWSLDLDAGLAKKSIKAEIILIICKKVMTKQLLLECWNGSAEDWHEIDEGIDRSNLVMLTISETTPGESLQWRDLTKSLKVIDNVSCLKSTCESLSE